MELQELLGRFLSDAPPEVRIDSRQVRAGDVFVAIKGTHEDGHTFIEQALANGARYIVCQDARADGSGRSYEVIRVDDSTAAAGILAQARHGYPAAKLTNLAVTGTNGKTTVAYLVHACLGHAGHNCGLMGTVVYDTGSGLAESTLTTPDCLIIAAAQRQMLDAGLRHMVLEASSHALHQNRLAGIEFKAAAFTNLSGDHLDYHRTTEDYLAAKTRLFAPLPPGATAVLNRQAPESQSIARETTARVLWYAVDEAAELTAHVDSMTVDGTVFTIEYQGRQARVTTPLLGRYNVANHLAAAGLCLAAGLDLDAVAAGLSSLDAIPGRLETIKGDGFTVVIDYAHTDDALANVLSALKPLCEGRLIVVFGCGGDRDTTKRPRMARAAEQWADLVVVTSDNPRSEEPQAIIGDIVAGFADPNSQRVGVEPDRGRAIEQAIEAARPNDIVLIAGKGHETYQIIGDRRLDFSDKDVAARALKERQCSRSR
jgi:UDP-N-acetylmuramoyl-L-alanyl-D-glutamate--2,6-diaminopimelate ligase